MISPIWFVFAGVGALAFVRITSQYHLWPLLISSPLWVQKCNTKNHLLLSLLAFSLPQCHCSHFHRWDFSFLLLLFFSFSSPLDSKNGKIQSTILNFIVYQMWVSVCIFHHFMFLFHAITLLLTRFYLLLSIFRYLALAKLYCNRILHINNGCSDNVGCVNGCECRGC